MRTRCAVLAAAGMIAVLGGCSTPSVPSAPSAPSTSPGVATLAAGGPDCLADEVLTALYPAPTPWSGRPAPAAGSVPEGFEPVRVVQCRGPVSRSERAAFKRRLSVFEIVLFGDLDPLLAALSRAPKPASPGQGCVYMAESKPEIYLLDAFGRAVRPSWPVDACGFLLPDARPALAGLSEISSTRLVVEQEKG